MKRLAIIRPLTISAVAGLPTGWTTTNNLLLPNPKQIATVTAGDRTLEIDLGSVQSIDTLYLGFVSATGGITGVTYGTVAYNTSAWPEVPAAANRALTSDTREHFLSLIAAPVNARFIRISGTFAATYSFGVLAIGLSFQASLGHEFGAGRPVEDTGTADRLLGGAFGINEGVTVGGYQWTFGDLTDAERESLYALVRAVGQTRSVLVVEDIDYTAGLAERIHWGLFDRLTPFERLSPGLTRWEFRVRDWG